MSCDGRVTIATNIYEETKRGCTISERESKLNYFLILEYSMVVYNEITSMHMNLFIQNIHTVDDEQDCVTLLMIYTLNLIPQLTVR